MQPRRNKPAARALSITSITRRTEAVCAFPVKICSASRRHVDTRMETGKRPHPIREGAESEIGRQIECATADRPVASRDIQDDITIEHGRRDIRNASRLVVEDTRTLRDLRDV